MKKLLSILLALCLLFFPLSAAAVTVVEITPITVNGIEELYGAIQPVEGVLTVPGGTVLCVDGDIFTEDKIVVEENAELCVLGGAAVCFGDIENSGSIVAERDAVLGIAGEGALINSGVIVIEEGAVLLPQFGGIVNKGSFLLSGFYACGVLGAAEQTEQEYAYRGEPITASKDACVILVPIVDDPAVDYEAAFAFAQEKFAPAQIFALARDYNALKALNADETVTGIYLTSDEDIVPLPEDTVISKRLCVADCDLLLQHGVTLTVEDYRNNLLFRGRGRIVCESEGAAGPECPTGGTLVLDGVPVLSGDPESGAINPTRDIVWVTSSRADVAIGAADELVIGDNSEADLHGDLSGLEGDDRFGIRMEGEWSRARLTGNFSAPCDFFCAGELNMEGYNLTVDAVYYYERTRVNTGMDGTIDSDETYYSVDLDPGLTGGERVTICFEEGQTVILSVLGIRYEEMMEDDGFRGLIIDCGWDIPQEDVKEITPELADVGGGVMEYCFTMPGYPLFIRGDWATQRVELTAFDATVAFEGIEGHTYDFAIIVDSVHMTDEALEPFGVTVSDVEAMIGQLDEELSGQGEVLRLFAFDVTDNEQQAFIDSYEYILPLDDAMQQYAYLMVLPVRVDDRGARIDGNPLECRSEEGVLTATFPDDFDAYIIVGTDSDPCAVSRVEITLNAPAEETYTDLPGNIDEGWRWNEQWNRPNAYLEGVRGAYLDEAYWTLADDAATPYIGVIGENGAVGVYFKMLAEPSYYFAEDVEIIINGATMTGYDTHVRDEDGKADILFIFCTYPPEPEEEILLGDADGDGVITVYDATIIQRELVGLHDDAFVPEATDADCDESLSVTDATAIQRWLVGLDRDLPIGQPIRHEPSNVE